MENKIEIIEPRIDHAHAAHDDAGGVCCSAARPWDDIGRGAASAGREAGGGC